MFGECPTKFVAGITGKDFNLGDFGEKDNLLGSWPLKNCGDQTGGGDRRFVSSIAPCLCRPRDCLPGLVGGAWCLVGGRTKEGTNAELKHYFEVKENVTLC